MDNAEHNPRAAIGGNGGPPLVDPVKFAQCEAKVADFVEKANEWIKLGRIENAEQAGLLVDFLTGSREVSKRIDGARVDAKKVYDELSAAVQKLFKPLLELIETCIAKLKPMQADWLRREQERLDSERRQKEAEAQQARIAAEEAAALAAANGDIAGEVEAAQLSKQADALAKDAARSVKAKATSASGAGRTMSIRKRKVAVIHSRNGVYMHFREHPKVIEVLQTLANDAVRAGEAFDPKILTVEEIEGAA